ncbi:hypothetical protein Bbelb_263660 [Branchiostoma belcheri]|nr:hypothetical protein Bbelb_263660 [Branchiostoma belcheri]
MNDRSCWFPRSSCVAVSPSSVEAANEKFSSLPSQCANTGTAGTCTSHDHVITGQPNTPTGRHEGFIFKQMYGNGLCALTPVAGIALEGKKVVSRVVCPHDEDMFPETLIVGVTPKGGYTRYTDIVTPMSIPGIYARGSAGRLIRSMDLSGQ